MNFLTRWLPLLRFRGSRRYWEDRYRAGGDSGGGSIGAPARYKADVLNTFVQEHALESIIEFGCGDGRQLDLAEYPAYIGVDVSEVAVSQCRARFSEDRTKRFLLLDDYRGEQAELALSLDVLYHLVEDDVYFDYLDRLFSAGSRFVVIYSTSTEDAPRTFRHVRHRDVLGDVAARHPEFSRMERAEAGLPAPVHVGQGLATRFFLYRRG